VRPVWIDGEATALGAAAPRLASPGSEPYDGGRTAPDPDSRPLLFATLDKVRAIPRRPLWRGAEGVAGGAGFGAVGAHPRVARSPSAAARRGWGFLRRWVGGRVRPARPPGRLGPSSTPAPAPPRSGGRLWGLSPAAN